MPSVGKMHHLIDPQLQKKAVRYGRKKDVLSILTYSISAVYLFTFYISGISRRIGDFAATFSMPLAVIVYLLSFLPLLFILFPITFVRDYLVEKRFGLSAQSVRSWLFDYIKGMVLGGILGYPLLLLLFFLFSHTPHYWWIFGVLGMALFQLFITLLFPILLFPLFFKQKPIEDDDFIMSIRKMFRDMGIKIEGIYSFNLSTKTKKENAVLAGLWKTRRVLLADTLMQKRSKEEILVVLAHEIAHHHRKHMMKLFTLGIITSSILFFTVHRIMLLFPGFPHNFNLTLSSFPIFMLIMGVLSFPIKLITNVYMRKKEKEADRIALKLTRKTAAFIELMAGLANTNLAVAYPKKFKVFLSYSHPPIGRRIEFAQRYEENST